MEFVCIAGPGVTKLGLDAPDAALLSPVDGPLSVRATSGLWCAATGCALKGNISFLFDGCYTDSHSAVTTTSALQAQTAAAKTYFDEDLDNPLPSAAGTFVCGRIDWTIGTAEFRVDPLSAYPLLHSRSSAPIVLVSNSVYLMENVAAKVGFSLPRSGTGLAINAALFTGQDRQTGHKDIQMIGMGQRLILEGGQLRERRAFPLNRPSGLTRKHLTSLAAKRLKERITVIKDHSTEAGLFADLSGGKDSRLVTAAMHAVGLGPIQTFTGVSHEGADSGLAAAVVRRFGFTPVAYPGTGPGEDYDAWTYMQRVSFRTQGHVSPVLYDVGGARLTGVSRLRGGWGELVRRPKESDQPLLDGRTLSDLIGRHPRLMQTLSDTRRGRWYRYRLMRRRPGCQRWFTRQLAAAEAQALSDQHDHLARIDLPDEKFIDLNYAADRVRRQLSPFTVMMNRHYPTFDPLNDIALWHLAGVSDSEAMEDGTLLQGLYKAIAPDFLDIPFASDKGANSHPLAASILPPLVPLLGHQDGPSIEFPSNVDQYWRAKWHYASLTYGVKDKLAALTEQLGPEHDLFQMLNYDRILDAYRDPASYLDSTTKAQVLNKIGLTLMWMAEEQTNAGVVRRVQP